MCIHDLFYKDLRKPSTRRLHFLFYNLYDLFSIFDNKKFKKIQPYGKKKQTKICAKLIKMNNQIRNNAIDILHTKLDISKNTATKIENGIFDKSQSCMGNEKKNYINEFYRLYVNLSGNGNVKNSELNNQKINNFDPYYLAWLNAYDIAPQNWDDIRQKHNRVVENSRNKAPAPNTTMFTCKCGSTQCYQYEKQTRSGDEAPTKVVTCTICYRSWRHND